MRYCLNTLTHLPPTPMIVERAYALSIHINMHIRLAFSGETPPVTILNQDPPPPIFSSHRFPGTLYTNTPRVWYLDTVQICGIIIFMASPLEAGVVPPRSRTTPFPLHKSDTSVV